MTAGYALSPSRRSVGPGANRTEGVGSIFGVGFEASTVNLIKRYFRSWQVGDWSALRDCLADEIRFDWGITTYTDPDEFVEAASAGIEWRDVDLLGSIVLPDRAMILYEATNHTDGVRIRTAEYLTIDSGRITAAVVVFAVVG